MASIQSRDLGPARNRSDLFSISVVFRAAAVVVALAAGFSGCSRPDPEALYAQGQQRARENNHAAAIVQFKSALQERPDWPEARLDLARSLLSAGQRDAAEAELSRMLTDPKVADRAVPLFLESLLVAGDAKRIVAQHASYRLAGKDAAADYKALIASAWLALGQREKAQAALREALQAKPDAVKARVMVARLMAGSGDIDGAIKLAEEVIGTKPEAKEAWLLKGDLLLARSDPSRAAARDAYAKALAIDPSFAAAHMALIQLTMRQGDLAVAKEQLAKMRAAVPDHPFTVLTEAQIAYVEERLPDARARVQALLRALPDLPSALHLAGLIEARTGSLTQATRHFRKALTADPALEVTREALAAAELRIGQPDRALATLEPLLTGAAAKPSALAVAAEARLQQGDAASAEALYLRAAKAKPDDLRYRASAALARIERGSWADAMVDLESIAKKSTDTFADEALFAARLRRSELDLALAQVDAMAAKQPAREAHWVQLRGSVQIRKRDYDAARTSFEKAVALQPDAYFPVGSLVDLDVLQGKPQVAQQRLDAYLKRQPQSVSALLASAVLASRQATAQPAEVRKRFEAAIAAGPTEPASRLRLVEYLLRRNLFKDALAVAQEASAAIPDDPRALDALGRAQGRAGDTEQAMNTFRRVAGLLPQSPQPFLRLAELYRANGNIEQAIAAYRQALDIAPYSGEAQQGLVETMVRSSKPAEVLVQVRRMRDSRPDSPLSYSLEAALLSRQRDAEGALRSLRTGFQRTGNSELGATLVGSLLRAGKAADAQVELSAWLKRRPNDPEALYLQAALMTMKGDASQAERQLLQLIDVAPRHGAGLNNLAALMAERKSPDAVSYARRALEQEPDNPAYLDTLALALAGVAKFDEAKAVHARAQELAPNNNNLRLTKAKIALLSGEKDVARAELDALERLGSAFPMGQEIAKLKSRL